MYSVLARLTKSDCIKGGSKLTDALRPGGAGSDTPMPCDDPWRVQRLLPRAIIAKARNCDPWIESGHAATIADGSRIIRAQRRFRSRRPLPLISTEPAVISIRPARWLDRSARLVCDGPIAKQLSEQLPFIPLQAGVTSRQYALLS